MIGTDKRLIAEEKVTKGGCPYCKEWNTLEVEVYSNVFILGLFGFGFRKRVSVSCKYCKKMFLNIYNLPLRTKDKVITIMKEARHKWYAYTGYVIFGPTYIWAIVFKKY